MITGLQVGNFKAFSETQYVHIRPITLIFGPNSSGKSSLIHSLILAHHAMEKGELDAHRTTIGGESVDLGGFKQYVYHHDVDRSVVLTFEFDATKLSGRLKEIFAGVEKFSITTTIAMSLKKELLEDVGESFASKISDYENIQFSDLVDALQNTEDEQQKQVANKYKYLNMTVKEFFLLQREPRVTTYEIYTDDVLLLKLSLRNAGFYRIDLFNTKNIVSNSLAKGILGFFTSIAEAAEGDIAFVQDAIADLIPNFKIDASGLLPDRVRRTDDLTFSEQEVFFPVRKGERKDDIFSAVKLYFPRILNEILAEVQLLGKKQIDRLKYLGPLRSYPPRHIAFAQYHDQNWEAGGGSAWEEVLRNVELRIKINSWLNDANKIQSPYELVVRHLLTIDDLEKHYTKMVSDFHNEYLDEMDKEGFYHDVDWTFDRFYEMPKNLKTVEKDIAEIGELVLIDTRTGTTVSHRDVGIGVSQVLPVLVRSYADKGRIIAIEQPEIHLHPALQAELGDVFIESALGENKNTFMIETHSEHVLLRIMRRMRETNRGELPDGVHPIKPKDVCVLFVEPDGNRSIVREMPLNDNGELVKAWPGGFFEEGLREIF